MDFIKSNEIEAFEDLVYFLEKTHAHVFRLIDGDIFKATHKIKDYEISLNPKSSEKKWCILGQNSRVFASTFEEAEDLFDKTVSAINAEYVVL
jgi:hypothetical protein